MTEEEAKTRWCPFVRYAEMNENSEALSPAYNRIGDDGGAAKCIGSACMAFRQQAIAVGDGTIWAKDDFYCGLAGKP